MTHREGARDPESGTVKFTGSDLRVEIADQKLRLENPAGKEIELTRINRESPTLGTKSPRVPPSGGYFGSPPAARVIDLPHRMDKIPHTPEAFLPDFPDTWLPVSNSLTEKASSKSWTAKRSRS